MDIYFQLDPSFDDIPLPSGFRAAIDYVEEHGKKLCTILIIPVRVLIMDGWSVL